MKQYLKLYKTSNEYYEDLNKPVIPHIIDLVSFTPEPPVVNPCEIDTMCPVVSPENIYVDYKGEEIRLNYDLGECWRLKDVIDSSQCAYYDRTRTLFVYQNDEGREREFNVKFVFANKSTGLECQSIVNVIQYGIANPCANELNPPDVTFIDGTKSKTISYSAGNIEVIYDLGVCWELIGTTKTGNITNINGTTIYYSENTGASSIISTATYKFKNTVANVTGQSSVTIYQPGGSPVIDPFNGHEYVDLGLPSGTLWAKMNVGANTEEDYGNYYQWGAIEPYENKSQYYTGQTLTRERDIASISMGGSWITPSKEDFEELIENTNVTLPYTEIGYGIKFTNKNDSTKYIVFPYAGFYNYGELVMDGGGAYVWTNEKSIALDSYHKDIMINSNFCKECGLSVRGVVKL